LMWQKHTMQKNMLLRLREPIHFSAHALGDSWS
jgi:hypothetical protein